MKIKFAALMLMMLLLVSSTYAETESQENNFSLRKKSQAGLRLGAWINGGDLPPALITTADSSVGFLTDIKSGSFYFEGFYAYNFYSALVSEISFGISNRGDVTFFDGLNTDIGVLNVYPILLHLKVYPLIATQSRFQPYFGAGVGAYYAHRTVQFIIGGINSYYEFEGESKTDFSYALQGGFDWLLSSKFALELNAKYMPIEMGDPFLTVEDYSATTVTVGIKYLTGGN